jgi:hypothetical protein
VRAQTKPEFGKDMEDTVSKLEAAQRRQQPGGVVEISCQNGKEPIARVEQVGRGHQHVAEHRPVDPMDQPRERGNAAPHLALVVAQPPLAPLLVVEPHLLCLRDFTKPVLRDG